jgi:hypothetical protein
VVIETMLFVMMAKRVDALPDSALSYIDELCRICQKRVRTDRNKMLLMRHPHTAVSLGIGHTGLTQAGYADDDFDAMLRNAFVSGQVEAVERLPYRAMELRWLRSLLFPEYTPDFSDLFAVSVVNTCAHPMYMTVADCYALTHALMYITDFGRRDLPEAIPAAKLGALVDAALAWNILSENLDLVGELLMASLFINNAWSPSALFGWHMLAKTWEDFGFLPCPSLEPKKYATLAGEQAAAFAFKHTYHTTYVGGILCALLLNRKPHIVDSRNASGVAVTRDKEAFLAKIDRAVKRAEQFAGRLPDAARMDSYACVQNATSEEPLLSAVIARMAECESLTSPHLRKWVTVLADAPIDSSALAVMMSDALLIHAARNYELGVLARALMDRAQDNRAASTTLIEAASFLAAQQLVSGVIGAQFIGAPDKSGPLAQEITCQTATALSSIACCLKTHKP